MGKQAWAELIDMCDHQDSIPEQIEQATAAVFPGWLPDLARLERAIHQAGATRFPFPDSLTDLIINPTLRLLPVAWSGLPEFLQNHGNLSAQPEPGENLLIIWQPADREGVRIIRAQPELLLALKLISEAVTPEMASGTSDKTVAFFENVLLHAVEQGILLSPLSALRRNPAYCVDKTLFEDFAAAEVFTLQWHLTQSCNLSCKHCYDRTRRTDFPLDRALLLLKELKAFCRRRFVQPQVSLSGGNPLLYPAFFDIYRTAADLGVLTAILGNATDRATIEKLQDIQQPAFYQVSLEGTEEHNDSIRGPGNYRKTLRFLEILKELEIPNVVMLTLTHANMDQVVPLAKQLEGIAEELTFNRLALFGEGAHLEQPSREDYQRFMEHCLAARATTPLLRFKDSLFNILLERDGYSAFGGCTGFGCGAAFNFMAILSDGEVHACRKFPSPIGNIHQQSLEEIYNSSGAEQYRRGSSACSDCRLRPVCGGCPAATASSGQDPFKDRDPYCFRTA